MLNDDGGGGWPCYMYGIRCFGGLNGAASKFVVCSAHMSPKMART